jgi:signal transduction histidine kinase
MGDREIYPMSSVDPADTKMELTCGGAKMVLLYLEDKLGLDAMCDFVCQTKMNVDYLLDRSNWISLDYYYRFLNRLVEFTGNSNSPYEAGLYASKKKCFGPIEVLLARCASIEATYKFLVWSAPRWNRVAEWKMLEAGRNACKLSVCNYTYSQTKNNCLCIQGVLATMPQVKGLPTAKVEELQCACDGADACIYKLTWVDRPVRLWAAIGFVMGLAAGVAVGYLTAWDIMSYLITLSLSLVGYFAGRQADYKFKLTDVYRRNEETAASLQESMRATEKLNEELQSKVEVRTRELAKSNRELAQALKDLKENQERMLIAEKQSAIGVLAAGMAHELNSPLNAIRLSVEGLQEDVGGDSHLQSQLALAGRATNRCKRIINDLLSFSREPKRETSVRIEDILEASLMLFEKEHPGGLRIERQIAKDLPTLQLDRMQIQQVVLNLLKNAADAMGDKGTIEVTLESSGGDVVLRVTDHGTGIREADRKRIFDPFFTTKTNGRGMGLGLSITYQLIQRNGGTIEVISREGQGSSFIVRFPVETGKPRSVISPS